MASSALKASAKSLSRQSAWCVAKHPAQAFILLLEDLIDAGSRQRRQVPSM